MSASLAALLIPELRWDPDHGFTHLAAFLEDALDLGVGGFVVHGGSRADVRALTTALQRDAKRPLLIAAEVAGGAGGTFRDATGLPPQAALGALRDDDAVRRAARLAARELRGVGVNWALGPVADLALEPRNPFLGSRAFSNDPRLAAEWVVAWIDVCQSEGVLACARTLPGEGRATVDPSDRAAAIDASGAELWATDLIPFRAAADAGVATMLVSQVSYAGLDARVGAARSPTVLRDLMRNELQYEGLLVSAAPTQGAARPAADESAAALAALAAGCDLILAPEDLTRVSEALDAAVATRALDVDAVDASLRRLAFWAEWATPTQLRDPTLDDVLWARQVSDTVIHAVRGVFANIGPVVDVILVDDDVDRAWRGDRRGIGPFLATLAAVGLSPREVEGPTEDGRGAVVVAVRGEPSPGRGRAGYADATRRRVAAVVAECRRARRSVVALLFGPPTLAAELPEVPNVICAWSGDRAMQEAAARRMA